MVAIATFISSFVLSFALTKIILRFSLSRELLDIPNERSSHEIPKPRLGGMAIAGAFYLTVLTLIIAGRLRFDSANGLPGVIAGTGVIVLLGIVDDLKGLGATVKLILQIVAASVVVLSGIVLRKISVPLIGTLGFGPLAVPITILWIVTMVNFYNFIDGIDGLAAGVALIATLFLAYISAGAGISFLVLLYLALGGSVLGFLRFNFPPARIFMGDTGSATIGFLFATLAVVGEGRGVPAFLTIIILGAVLGDAGLTLLRRMIRGEKITLPHKTHYYQRLTTLGLSHKQVTILEYLIAALLGVGAIFAFEREWVFVVFFSILWVAFFLWVVAKIRSLERGTRLRFEGHPLAIALADVGFVALSYFLSYYLRLNFRFPHDETQSMLLSLPLVLVIRTAVFHIYRLYRGVWRYTSLDDLVRIIKAITLGSLVMIVSFTLLFRFKSFPRSVFVIDWFILTVLMTGSRMATRWFHELPKKEDIVSRRVLIVGTGSLAEKVMRDVKEEGGYRIVGFIDDREEIIGRMIHGAPVLGKVSDIGRVVKDKGIDEIIVLEPLNERIGFSQLNNFEKEGVEVRIIRDPSKLYEDYKSPDDVSDSGREVVFLLDFTNCQNIPKENRLKRFIVDVALPIFELINSPGIKKYKRLKIIIRIDDFSSINKRIVDVLRLLLRTYYSETAPEIGFYLVEKNRDPVSVIDGKAAYVSGIFVARRNADGEGISRIKELSVSADSVAEESIKAIVGVLESVDSSVARVLRERLQELLVAGGDGISL